MSLFILFSAANNTVAAPSLKLLALAAVIVPPLLKAGLNFKILFLSNFNGSSSLLTVIEPCLDLISTLQISLSKKPGEPSKKEKNIILKKTFLDKAKKSETYQKVLETFSDAELIDIDIIKEKNDD